MLEDIHDIRPPVMTGMDPELVRALLWGAGAILACALVFLIIRYWLKKRENRTQPAQALALLTPYETAVRDLEQCMTGFGHDAKIFYFEMSRILKTYVSGTFQINCSEMTSQEMARAVKALDFKDAGLKTQLIQFQDRCDPIRYMPLETQGALEAARMQQDLALAGSLVARIEEVIAEATAKDNGEDA
ncbi:MAG: hypothetical protein MI799_22590 [Desulfobacterales bacterium]|nr:hypothetical protein [Desulfobacterales bacterium]